MGERMERRTFLGIAGSIALIPGAAVAQAASPAPDTEAVMLRLIEWYRLYADPQTDPAIYRSFVTDDYLLLENGELQNVEDDIKFMQSNPPDFQRTDRFDFRYARVDGDHAYLVYFLESDIKDSVRGERSRRWLESAIFRRVDGRWRAAMLHSTKISPPNA